MQRDGFFVEDSSAKTMVLESEQREGVADSLSDTSEHASQDETVNSSNNHTSNISPAAAPHGAASSNVLFTEK